MPWLTIIISIGKAIFSGELRQWIAEYNAKRVAEQKTDTINDVQKLEANHVGKTGTPIPPADLRILRDF
jgi:hypothetical protein